MKNSTIKKSRFGRPWLVAVKLATVLLMGILIYFKLSDQENFGTNFRLHIVSILQSSESLLVIGIVLLLMPLNWLMEALKWKLLVKKRKNISLQSAFKGVITGLAFGFVTPHAVGDYAGRIWQLSGIGNEGLVGSVWMGKVLQMTVTGLLGMLGVYVFYINSNYSFLIWYFLLAGIGVILLILAGWWFLKQRGHGLVEKIRSWFRIVLTYNFSEIAAVFGISMLRYLVFSTQFVLVLYVLNVTNQLIALYAGVSWVFLMKSIVPSFNFLSDLGIRELSALTFFDLYGADQSAVIAASLLLWSVNILVPALLGLFFVLKLKIAAK